MDFLRELFTDGQTLTYDQLAEAAKSKGFQVVNAAGGAYVPKAQVDTLNTQLGEANKKLEGYDPNWKEQAEAAQKKLEAQQNEFTLERAVAAYKPRSVKMAISMLDREKLTFAGGEVIGLDKQMDAMQKGEETSFLFGETKPSKTGLSHQNSREVGGDDKKEAANEALRSFFGRTE